MHYGNVATGFVVGNGAAINVSLGWIPDYAKIINLTDGDLITEGFLKEQVIPFTSGGTLTVAVGDKIKGATSGATARIKQIQLYSGTWAGGDAAGFFVIDTDDLTGTFQSENVYVDSDSTAGTNDATVTANVAMNVSTGAAVAGATGTSALSPYTGSTTAAKGFTIGSVVAEEAKILGWFALRSTQDVLDGAYV